MTVPPSTHRVDLPHDDERLPRPNVLVAGGRSGYLLQIPTATTTDRPTVFPPTIERRRAGTARAAVERAGVGGAV